jgi:hypothetical protein
VFVCILVYLTVTMVLAYVEPLWRDEVYTLRTTDLLPWAAGRRAITYDLQAPGYFVLEAAWRVIASKPWAARIPSVVFGAAAVAVGARLFTRVVPVLGARWAAVLLATHPVLIWAGTEARWASLAILLGTTFTLLALRVYFEGRARERIFVVLCGAACLYVNYYLGFLLVSVAIAVALTRPRDELARYLVDMCVVALLFLPLASAVLHQIGIRHGAGVRRPVTIQSIGFGVERDTWYLALARDVFASPFSWARAARWGIRVVSLLGLAGLAIHVRRVSTHRFAKCVLVAATAVLSIALGAVVTSMIGLPWYLHYHAIFVVMTLAVPVIIASALGPPAAVVTVVALIASNVAGVVAEHRTLGRCGNSRAVALEIERRVSMREPILVVPADATQSLSLYYTGTKVLHPVPRVPRSDMWTMEDMIPEGAKDLDEAIVRAGNPSALWIYSEFPGIDEMLETWLEPGWKMVDHILVSGGRYSGGRPAVAHLRHFVSRVARGNQNVRAPAQ